MKNYKRVIPVVLVGVLALSVYNSVSSKATIKNEYNTYLKNARNAGKEGIIVDAVKNYEEALSIDNNVDIYKEVADLYYKSEKYFDAINWANSLLDNFPKNAEGYEILAKSNYKLEKYDDCLQTIKQAKDRKIETKEIADLYAKLAKLYSLTNNYEDVHSYHKGIASVYDDNAWKFIKYDGTSLHGKYLFTGVYNDELFPVIDMKKEAYFVDLDGNKKKNVVKLKNIQELGMASSDYYTIKADRQWYLYNFEGKKITGPYQYISNVNEDVVGIKDKNSKWSYIYVKDLKKSNKSYDEIILNDNKMAYVNERFFVRDGVDCYMIDYKGNKIGDSFENARAFNEPDSYAAVRKNNKWGFVDSDGNMIIKPTFQEAHSFYNNYAAVKVDGKWGFIDASGKMVIDPKFDDVKDFNKKGSTLVKQHNMWNLLSFYVNEEK